MVHTVIFDVGGTLVKARSVFETFAELIDPQNKEALFKTLRREFMKIYRDGNPEKFLGIKEIVAIVLKKTAQKFNLKDISGEINELYETAYLAHASLFDDSLPTLERLRQLGLKMIVVSDADPDVLNQELSTFRIFKYFDHILISGIVKAYKPSDKMIKAIAEHCDKPYSDILFVGDTEVDILAAKKLQAKSVLIRRNGEFPLEADHRITGLNELFDIIESYNKY